MARFGIVSQMSPDLQRPSKTAFKNDAGATNGDPTYALPIPATFVIDRTGTIRLAHVDPGFIRRLELADVVQALQRLSGWA